MLRRTIMALGIMLSVTIAGCSGQSVTENKAAAGSGDQAVTEDKAAAGSGDQAGLRIENGALQPFLEVSDLRAADYSNEDSDILRFCVYVETDHDTDNDGKAL